MNNLVKIYAVQWAGILVKYALFVMQYYLTEIWKLDIIEAAGIMNIWGGICMILPLFLLFLVDAFLGNFKMLVMSSIASSMGIGVISISTLPVVAKPTQKSLFYTGMALLAVGMSGNLVSEKKFLKEQMDISGGYKRSKCLRISQFILVGLAPVIGAVALPNIPNWSIRFGIPGICTVVAMLLFLSGWCDYNRPHPRGSPLTNVCRVFVASARKRSQPLPRDKSGFYFGDDGEKKRTELTQTNFLGCLEKAAIISSDKSLKEQVKDRWRLCKVSEVEEAKIAVRMVPMWLTFIVIGIISSTANTYFVEQAANMNPSIGYWSVPLPIFLLFFEQANRIFTYVYTKLLSRLNIYAPPVGIALAMILSVLCCVTAARVESGRLLAISQDDTNNRTDSANGMSAYWLLFQFFLLAGVDAFLESGIALFYDQQAPESMKDYLIYITKVVSGLGFMLSVAFVTRISEKGGNENWFQPTLNDSHLDKYYRLLAMLSSVNLAVYIFVACFYRYRQPQTTKTEATGAEAGVAPADGSGGDDGGETLSRGIIQCCC